MQKIAALALVVRDYDEAIAFYTQAMRFELVEDTPMGLDKMGGDKRWVVVAPAGQMGAALVLARATAPAQQAAVGNQTGGRVFLFLHTDDFWDDYRHLQEHGVHFVESPRQEPYGTVVVFEDIYGNKWDLIQRHAP